MKTPGVCAEQPPSNFIEWWVAHTGCPDVGAYHIAWHAVKLAWNEVNTLADAIGITAGADRSHHAHATAMIRMMEMFHGAKVSNGTVRPMANNAQTLDQQNREQNIRS